MMSVLVGICSLGQANGLDIPVKFNTLGQVDDGHIVVGPPAVLGMLRYLPGCHRVDGRLALEEIDLTQSDVTVRGSAN